MFVSKNEVSNFIYRDSYITEDDFSGDRMTFRVEALIVKAANSANSNYTDSYADVTEIIIEHPDIKRLTKLGYKQYDANDRLIKAVEDEDAAFALIDLERLFNRAFLTDIKKDEEGAVHIMIELPDEDPCAITDEYEMVLESGDIIFRWEKYLNRVQDI